MELQNRPKDQGEPGSLRLVPGSKGVRELPDVQKQFVNFIFFRVNPLWRKLDNESKSIFKQEFQSVHDSFQDDFLLYSYSLVGFDSKADLMLWRIGHSLDGIQDMTAKLYRTNLGSYLETADNYLSITKKMMFIDDLDEDRQHIQAGAAKYHFVYP